ncbi:FadR/GntR family transcriptional regulator [Pseudonocardia sp. MH-G8]|uniref:FadR/GntR family transcriptional regulator n=1 Tax=Pseudonocardia sp. MH-G8 TaxID=1854588 RepID=UPI000BA007FC|nr:FadR/GntR family transcriptional regulator [Pseudonocardia sp. MH-G8]OZM78786.1 GntR family transcriptional regulator [Pseudonocardia sp. MH-G8]
MAAPGAGVAPIRRDSPVSQVARRLLDELTAGEQRPGTRLPSERRLAENLGVGRSAIREAIAVLEVLGIVEVRVGSGTYVRGTVSDLLPQAIEWGLMLGERHTRDLVEARRHLEAVTARLAAQRATDDDVARLRARLERMRETADAVAEFTEADVEFHLEVARIAGNTVLRDILHSVRALLRVWIQRAVGADGDTSATLAEHEAVFRAVERKAPDAAATAMETHMEKASARLERSLSTP